MWILTNCIRLSVLNMINRHIGKGTSSNVINKLLVRRLSHRISLFFLNVIIVSTSIIK